ncbi:MAG: hypothetical protein RIR94_689 [Bacteroidota bacterium]|jgi:hypothetical protein
MKIQFVLFLSFITQIYYAQIGIGTNTPDNSAALDIQSIQKGFLLPRMTAAERTSIASPATGLQVYETTTNAIWYYNGTFWINTQAMASYGDIKSGIQSTDHAGWVLLDGRQLSTLSTQQQLIAASVGLTNALPNANNTYLSQNGTTLASVTGSNTLTLTQAQLPNVNFTGSTTVNGSHLHTVDPNSVNTSTDGLHNHTGNTTTNGTHTHEIKVNDNNVITVASGSVSSMKEAQSNWTTGTVASYASVLSTDGSHAHTINVNNNGNHLHTVDIPSTNSSTDGSHSHSVTVPSNGQNAPIQISPKTLSVNMFIYLGN